MSILKWNEFLGDWATCVLKNKKYLEDHHPNFKYESDIIGASQETISKLEKKLDVKLPTSYKSFLSASNEWPILTGLNNYFYNVEKINWFSEKEPEWVREECWDEIEISDEDYLQYDEKQNILLYKREHLKKTLQISEPVDGEVFLLNPEIITQDGEWEAWRLRAGTGARRYKSFEEMMIAVKNESLKYINEYNG